MADGDTPNPDASTDIVEGLRRRLIWEEPSWPASSFPGALANGDAVDLGQRTLDALGKASLVRDGGPFVEMCSQVALREAGRGQRPAGALQHLLVAVKELVAVAGLSRHAGSPARADVAPETHDAPITAALRKEGAVILGSTAMHELAFGVTGVNDALGSPRNPHDGERICGGSSSGSAAAVASAIVDLGVGSDTGGSVRIPSALCGVVGFKPAYGTLSSAGVLPLAPSLDHLGLHARSVGEVRIAMNVLADMSFNPVELRRVGVDPHQMEMCDREVEVELRRAIMMLRESGVEVVDLDLPDRVEVYATSTAIIFAEAYAVNRSLYETHLELIGSDVRDRLTIGARIPGSTYFAAREHQHLLRKELMATLEKVNAFIGPTVPCQAPTFQEVAHDPSYGERLVRFTRLGNVTGVPALTLPLDSPGLPVGLQIMAGSNEATIAFAEAIEARLSAG